MQKITNLIYSLIVKVWIILIISVPLIISTLYWINRFVAFEDTIVVRFIKKDSRPTSKRLMKSVTPYVIGLILHQGIRFRIAPDINTTLK